MNSLSLVALLFTQDPTPPPAAAEARVFDSAALIVNEEIITDFDVLAATRREVKPGASEEDRRRTRDEIVTTKVQDLLEEQAGQVMGYDEKMVDKFVQNQLDRQREQAGSVARLATQLKAFDLDSKTQKEDVRSHVYGLLWQRSVTGIDAAPKGRVAADRYVRPGRLYFEFKEQETAIANDPLLTVHDFGLKIVGAPEDVHDVLAQLRERVVAGANFDEEATKLEVNKVPPGISTDRPLSGYRPVKNVYEFLHDAQPGDVSEVLEIRQRNGSLDGYRLIYLESKKHRDALSFADAELQNRFRKDVQSSLDRYRIDTALDKLYRAAYVWPPQMLGRTSTLEN
ncbi:MAG: hypothetical protein K8S98_15245 [Planctomycetes bacterium]|nr:hypothetical protein [Planctomycetota bacterium]